MILYRPGEVAIAAIPRLGGKRLVKIIEHCRSRPGYIVRRWNGDPLRWIKATHVLDKDILVTIAPKRCTKDQLDTLAREIARSTGDCI